jgi:hypothetical protein
MNSKALVVDENRNEDDRQVANQPELYFGLRVTEIETEDQKKQHGQLILSLQPTIWFSFSLPISAS